MFADPVSNLMLIILIFFAGLLVMFVFMLRSLELNAQNQEETRRQLSISLTDLERKVGELTFALQGKDDNYTDDGIITLAEKKTAKAPAQGLDDLSTFFEQATDKTPGDNEQA